MRLWDRLMRWREAPGAEPEQVNPDLTEVKRQVELLHVKADRAIRRRRAELQLEARRRGTR